MYVCSCNPFNDKKVKECLKEAGDEKTRVSEVYRQCSGGAKPQCCSCLPLLKEMVMDHNNAVSVKRMKDGLQGTPAAEPADTPPAAATPKPGEPVL